MPRLSVWKSDRGNVGISLSLAAVPLLLVAGGAVDYSYVLTQQVRMQNAADAAVLSSVNPEVLEDQRKSQAERYFERNLSQSLAGTAKISSYTFDRDSSQAQIRVEADIPITFLKLAGWTTWPLAVTATAKAMAPGNRVLDIAMCIDVTGSMQDTIDAAADSAMLLEADINREMRARNLPPFDAVRTIVHSYRDFGGNNPDYRANHYRVDTGGYVDQMPSPGAVWMPPGDSTNYGDQVPLQSSASFNLPQQAGQMRIYLNGLFANGGGDDPESGLECVNAALNDDWLQIGDPVPGGVGTIDDVFPMIAIWTDVDAHPPSHPWSLLNANYPAEQDMPRDFDALKAKWLDGNRINQKNKLIVTFMPSNTPVWDNVRGWPGYFNGGTLAAGNANSARKIVDAIATLPSNRSPVLTE
jgi:Flp pilus assembly protein TadG